MRQWIMRWIQCFDVIVRRASDVLFCTKPMRAALSVTDGCLSHQRASMYLHSLSRGRIRSAELLMTANELLSLMLKERSVNHRLRNAVDNSHLWFTWSCLMHEPALVAHYWVTETFKWIIVCLKMQNSRFCHFTELKKQHYPTVLLVSGFEQVWLLMLLERTLLKPVFSCKFSFHVSFSR